MLLIVLIAGVSPTLGMHFCGKDLRSIEFLSQPIETHCCSKPPITNSKECDNTESMLHSNCCATHKVQIETDSYQFQEQHFNLAPIFSYLQADWFTTNYISQLIDCDLSVSVLNHFPPNGYDVKDQNILNFICILRI